MSDRSAEEVPSIDDWRSLSSSPASKLRDFDWFTAREANADREGLTESAGRFATDRRAMARELIEAIDRGLGDLVVVVEAATKERPRTSNVTFESGRLAGRATAIDPGCIRQARGRDDARAVRSAVRDARDARRGIPSGPSMRAGVILALCGACGDVVGTTTDAAMEPDARSPCNQAAEFGPPVALAGVNTPAVDLVSDVSADDLTIYIASNRAGAAVQLFYATRATRSDSFGVPVPLYAPAPAYDDFSIAVSSDGLTGIVASIRNTTDQDLFVVTRPSVLASFDAGTAVLGLNTATTDATPKFSRDDATLYFDSERNGSRDLYRVAAIGGGFGTPTPISEINSSALDAGPVISADELTIYFLSQRPPSSDGDIYMAVRPSRSAAFGAPVRVTSLNSPAFDGPGALSIDGCTIYLSSERNGNFDIFVARKPA